jgi:hypothetical protein
MEERPIQRESNVWYAFMDEERQSAIPVQWKDLRRVEDEALVFRPGEGLEGWTRLDEVKKLEQRRSVTGEAVAAVGEEPADASGSASAGRGRMRQLNNEDASEGGAGPSAGGPTNLQRGISVTVDPHTGGLVGLPEGWQSVVPEALREKNPRSEQTVPEALRAPPLAEEGLRLRDEAIIGLPFNVTKWSAPI